jgi:Flp pilus assembly protein CpaB
MPLVPLRRWPRRARIVLARRPLAFWALALAVAATAGLAVEQAVAAAAHARLAWGTAQAVAVTTRRVAAGEVLGPADVVVQQWPSIAVPPGAVRAVAPGTAAAAVLEPGEAIQASRLGPAGRSALAAALPAGRRAVAVRRDGDADLPLAPGDLVDVVAVRAGTTGSVAARDAPVITVDPGRAVLAVTEAEEADVAAALAGGDVVLALSSGRSPPG